MLETAVLVVALMPAVALSQREGLPTPEDAIAQHVHGGEDPKPSASSVAPSDGSGQAAAGPVASTSPAPTGVSGGPAGPPDEGGLHLTGSLSQMLGMGTFFDPRYYSSLSAAFSAAAAYGFTVKSTKLSASASWLAYYDISMPKDETGRRAAPWDLRLGLAAPAFFTEKSSGIVFTPSLGLILPTTIDSWHAGLIANLSAGVGASRKVGDFALRLSVSGSRGFHTSQFNATPASSRLDDWGNAVVLCRTGEAFCGSAGMNTAWSLVAGGGVNWSVTKTFSASVGLNYARSWKYAATDDPADPLTAKALDSFGNPAAHTGMGQGDRLIGTFGVVYQLTEHVGIDASFFTAQSPLIKDPKTGNSVLRFPFFTIGESAANTTSFSVGLSGSY